MNELCLQFNYVYFAPFKSLRMIRLYYENKPSAYLWTYECIFVDL